MTLDIKTNSGLCQLGLRTDRCGRGLFHAPACFWGRRQDRRTLFSLTAQEVIGYLVELSLPRKPGRAKTMSASGSGNAVGGFRFVENSERDVKDAAPVLKQLCL
jgi:hypothetical protein